MIIESETIELFGAPDQFKILTMQLWVMHEEMKTMKHPSTECIELATKIASDCQKLALLLGD